MTSYSRFWHAPAHYAGQTVLCIAGGPSVADIDLKPARGTPTIAINGSILGVGEWAPVYYYGDHRWWRWYGDKVPSNYPGRIITSAAASPVDLRVLRMNKEYVAALSRDPTSLSGLDSGYQAINLAFHLGARRIILAGYDMGFSNGRQHHHEEYPDEAPESNYTEKFAPRYEALFEQLQASKVEVVTVTPTPLDLTRMSLEKALR